MLYMKYERIFSKSSCRSLANGNERAGNTQKILLNNHIMALVRYQSLLTSSWYAVVVLALHRDR